jgi:hypothetical protein
MRAAHAFFTRASLPDGRRICYADAQEIAEEIAEETQRRPIRRFPMQRFSTDPAHALTLQFLAWVAEEPRTYVQAMEAWRSTCPRLSIWEDAILDGLVGFDGGPTRNQSRVMLTAKGRALLRASAAAPAAPRVRELVR